ncbi:MAG TPA: hypothetical protein VLL54_06540 [Pyrinomonadaceae bacterium]|nr:hypothetical protein [Pyrinomonadaceae bacterium]
MLPRLRGTLFTERLRAAWLASVLLIVSPVLLNAEPKSSNVVCRAELSATRREELANKLRKISGLKDLRFDERGFLRAGESLSGGQSSASARTLIAEAMHGSSVLVIEDASNQANVAFAQVVPGKWKTNAQSSPPVFVIQIDFADFEHLVGDNQARDAFNVGWVFLHELDHVVSDSPDASKLGETGECEAHINQMRRECDLPERADYFSELSPLTNGNTFMTRLVRLSFAAQEPATKKKKLYWLTWDANAVGGVELSQVASAR